MGLEAVEQRGKRTGSKEEIEAGIGAVTLGAPRAAPSAPGNGEGPLFHEPWEAQAFALALSLNERGVFTWQQWAITLGEEIRKAQAAGDLDTGETYYRHWLAALERLVIARGLADARTLIRTREAWQRAAARTPHGTPIELRPSDFGD